MTSNQSLIAPTDRGLYCAAGDFYIDPWRPVDRAVVSHGHSDHARFGCESYLTHTDSVPILQTRLRTKSPIEGIQYGKKRAINGVNVSLHPAGHILGSSQVRVEHQGEVWVFSGDYKTQADRTCTPFEPVPCHTFITESTFGLPIYRWKSQEMIFDEINGWWRENQQDNRTSVIFAYSLGKAQRIIAGIDPSIGPIFLHGAVDNMTTLYREAGIDLPATQKASAENASEVRGKGLIIAPPSAGGTPWIKKFRPLSPAFASGWMAVRGARRWQSLDRGFVLSDHADWPGLMDAIKATGANRIGVTHGSIDTIVRYLSENMDLESFAVPTRYSAEPIDDDGDEVQGDDSGEQSS